uniref:BPTI/Kunitz inhibitor domain-containing protein n=1 Tax=Oncorhynchus mykiss TaxID=8022 RepID=A0A8K9UGX7_ONCMY
MCATVTRSLSSYFVIIPLCPVISKQNQSKLFIEVCQTNSYSSSILCAFSDGVCGLPVDHGSCFAMLLMHYYNAEEGNCRVFHYSGCQGNGNRFETREQCLQTCMESIFGFHGNINKYVNSGNHRFRFKI